MKIIELHVSGFRSLKSLTWSPGDLNLLIGPNASGKTNVLRALEMLHTAAKGGLGKYVQQEGGMEPLVWDGNTDKILFRVKMTPVKPGLDVRKDALTFDLALGRLGKSSSYRIENELLANFYRQEIGEKSQPLKLLERNPRHAVLFSPQEKRLTAPPESVPEEEALLSTAAGPFSVNEWVSEFQKNLASWKIYQSFSTDRDAAIRLPQVTRADTQVNPDGQNLVSVLHFLYTSSREFKWEINSAMTAAFGEAFEELLFPPAADQRIQLRIRWRYLQKEQSAADLSDGTLRFLFLLAVLANPSPPPLIAIEEPETGLHPSMLPIVAEYAREASSRAQVILTTHSPELLDAFGEEATTAVLEWLGGETYFRVLSGQDLAYWLKRYTLGELYRTTELEDMV